MPKRVRTIRDTMRHRRIARSSPLARIPEGVLIGKDVYHSTPPTAGQAANGERPGLVGAA